MDQSRIYKKGGIMKLISIRIEEEQLKKLQELAQEYKIIGVSSLIRRAIDLLLTSEERRKT